MVKRLSALLVFLFLIWNSLFAGDSLFLQPKAAINFTLPNLDNQSVSLSDFQGSGVLLFFWTTWCPYCREELKKINSMYEELKKEGLIVLVINTGESEMRVENFIRRFSFSYPVLLDKDFDVVESYGVLGVPTYILIDQQGNIVFKSHYFPKREYKALLLK